MIVKKRMFTCLLVLALSAVMASDSSRSSSYSSSDSSHSSDDSIASKQAAIAAKNRNAVRHGELRLGSCGSARNPKLPPLSGHGAGAGAGAVPIQAEAIPTAIPVALPVVDAQAPPHHGAEVAAAQAEIHRLQAEVQREQIAALQAQNANLREQAQNAPALDAAAQGAILRQVVHKVQCPRCRGLGGFDTFGKPGHNDGFRWYKCPLCDGSTQVAQGYTMCGHCRGAGGFDAFNKPQQGVGTGTSFRGSVCRRCNDEGYTYPEQQIYSVPGAPGAPGQTVVVVNNRPSRLQWPEASRWANDEDDRFSKQQKESGGCLGTLLIITGIVFLVLHAEGILGDPYYTAGIALIVVPLAISCCCCLCVCAAGGAMVANN